MAHKQLGKYEIIDRIGRGGMAEVYRGYHPSLDRYVAVKLLHPFLADDPEFKDRFENEARNVAKLKHPNIVQVYDFDYDVEGESYYMVMELINGPTLKDRLLDLTGDGRAFPIHETIRIIKSATDALDYAHQRSMIHRDVKPANLMLDEDGRVVLTDFGIAKIVTGTQFTASGGMVGTPAYMAPEQGLGEAGDERSDIYSLGVILFQLLTGRLPYDADTPLAIILKHLNDPLPNPCQLNPEISEEMSNVIRKALAKEPEDRYQTARAFGDDLARLDKSGQRRRPVPLLAETHPAPAGDMPHSSIRAAAERMTGTIPPGSLPARGAPGRLRLSSVLLLVAMLLVIGAVALLTLGRDDTPLQNLIADDNMQSTLTVTGQNLDAAAPIDGERSVVPTDFATERVANAPTIAPTFTPTHTTTPTRTPTVTPTPRPTSTPTDTPTPTPNLTQTALFFAYETVVAATPTPNMTQTLDACDFEYIVVSPERYREPPAPRGDPNNPRLVRSGDDFTVEIVLRNTGTCPWPDGVRLTYNPELTENPDASVSLDDLTAVCAEDEIRPGLNFAQQEQSNFFLEGPVNITGISESITFTGMAPDLYGCYYGVWDLLYPNSNLTIGRPLLLTIRVWGSG